MPIATSTAEAPMPLSRRSGDDPGGSATSSALMGSTLQGFDLCELDGKEPQQQVRELLPPRAFLRNQLVSYQMETLVHSLEVENRIKDAAENLLELHPKVSLVLSLYLHARLIKSRVLRTSKKHYESRLNLSCSPRERKLRLSRRSWRVYARWVRPTVPRRYRESRDSCCLTVRGPRKKPSALLGGVKTGVPHASGKRKVVLSKEDLTDKGTFPLEFPPR